MGIFLACQQAANCFTLVSEVGLPQNSEKLKAKRLAKQLEDKNVQVHKLR